MSTAALEKWGLDPGGYFLYVSRLEPENNAHAVIAGFERAGLDQRLVVVGDAPYTREYIESLKCAAGPRVVFTGSLYGQAYIELQSHALAYVQATEVGGTHPALVEAMGIGNCVLVNDVPENREVAGDAALYFKASDPETLAQAMRRVVEDPDLARSLRACAEARARARFSWDAVADQYERLFATLTGRETKAA